MFSQDISSVAHESQAFTPSLDANIPFFADSDESAGGWFIQ